jgi:hypothetical protein
MEAKAAFGETTHLLPRFMVGEERPDRVQMSNVSGYASIPVAVG